MSYPTSNWHTLMFSNMEACVMAVALSALLHYLIPDVEPRKPPPRIEKDAARIRHESLLSGTVATIIFVVFQICDLSDSLSALMAGSLILFPMHYRGAVISSIWRVVGVVLACLYILVVQLIIYDFSNHMILMMPLIGLGLAFSARLHVMEKVGAGVELRQHHYHRHYVRPESASVSGSGVQRSVPHHLGDGLAGGDADLGFSHAPPAELFRGDALCGERLICRWEGGETAPCFPVLLIQRRRLFRDDPASRIGFRPSSRMHSPQPLRSWRGISLTSKATPAACMALRIRTTLTVE